jgi:hypothetical protein
MVDVDKLNSAGHSMIWRLMFDAGHGEKVVVDRGYVDIDQRRHERCSYTSRCTIDSRVHSYLAGV